MWTVHLYDRNKSVFKLSMKVGFFHIGSHKGWVLLCPPVNSYSWQRVCVGSRSGHTIHRGWFHQSYKSLCPINIRSMLTSSLRLDFSQSSLAYYYHIDKKNHLRHLDFCLKEGIADIIKNATWGRAFICNCPLCVCVVRTMQTGLLPLPTYFPQRKRKKSSPFSFSESKSLTILRTSISRKFTDIYICINVLLNFKFWHIWQNFLLMNVSECLSNVQMSRNPCHSNEMTEQNYTMYAYSWD